MMIDAALTGVVVVGLPIWLLAEELLCVAHRYAEETTGLAWMAQ